MNALRILYRACLLGVTATTVFGLGCAEPTGPTIRVVTWNVHAMRAGAEAVADELRRLEPDIICLQEVESGTLVSPGPQQAQVVARRLGMGFVATPVPETDSKEEQIAILARGELRDPLNLSADTGRSYGIEVEYVPPQGGEPIRVIAVHLTSTDWSSIGRFFATGDRRMREVKHLVGRIKGRPADLIVAGDLNAGPGAIEHLTLALDSRWVATFEPTFPSDWPSLQLDHIFLKGSLRAQRIFVERTAASDHRMLAADISLRGKTPTPTTAGLHTGALEEP